MNPFVTSESTSSSPYCPNYQEMTTMWPQLIISEPLTFSHPDPSQYTYNPQFHPDGIMSLSNNFNQYVLPLQMNNKPNNINMIPRTELNPGFYNPGLINPELFNLTEIPQEQNYNISSLPNMSAFPNTNMCYDISGYDAGTYFPSFPSQRRVSTGDYPAATPRRCVSTLRINRSNTIAGHEFPGPMKHFQCNYPGCLKEFKRTEHLKRHLNTVHTNEKPYACLVPNCHKRFSRSDNLSQHLRTHRSKNQFGHLPFPSNH